MIDELARTNVLCSRHEKRWQDVFELLKAGMNVDTMLNVQHLEIFSDIVTKISGITVYEPLPDSLLDRADETEFIGLPPIELSQRQKEGKGYGGEFAERESEGKLLPFKLENEAQRDILFSSVSHNLSTPLAAIPSAFTVLLQDGEKVTLAT